jgi:hypothetical protein
VKQEGKQNKGFPGRLTSRTCGSRSIETGSVDGGSQLQTFENEVSSMQNRVVSYASLMLVVAAVMFFLAGAWGIMSGKIGEGDGVMALAGWLVIAVVFSYRFADPMWLDAVSIVKSR